MSAEPQHLADVSDPVENLVARNARQLSIAQIVKRGARIAALFIAARLLGVQRFGIYALILTITEMVAVLSGAGYVDFLTREVAKRPGGARRLTRGVLLVRFIYIAPFTALALLILLLLRFPAASIESVALLSISLLPRAIAETAQGLLKGLRKFEALPWAELLQGGVLVFLVYIFLLQDMGIPGVVLAEIFSAVAGCVLLAVAATRIPSFGEVSSLRVREIMKATWPFSIFPFIGNLYDRADVVVLSKMAGNFATGVYAIPYRIYSSFQIIPASIMGAWLPAFSASARPQAARQCRTVMKLLLLATLCIVLFTNVLARPVVLHVLGSQYEASIRVIKVLVWALPLAFWSYAASILLMAFHHERVFIFTSLVCSAFNLGANIALVPRYSYMAAAVVTVITELLLVVLNCYFLVRRIEELVLPRDLARISAAFLTLFLSIRAMEYFALQWWIELLPCALFAMYAWREIRWMRAERSLEA